MGKNGLLGIADQETMMNHFFAVRRFFPCLLSTLYCLLFLCGCAFPRIIVLDDPLSPEEHLNLGVAYEQNKEYESALKEYEKALKEHPAAHLYMGNIYFLRNEYSEAEYHYKLVIDEDSKNADAYNNLAWLYYTKKVNLKEAEVLALKAIDLNPEKNDIYQDTLQKIREALKRE